MKYQILFSLKNVDEKNSGILSSAAVMIGTLRVKGRKASAPNI